MSRADMFTLAGLIFLAPQLPQNVGLGLAVVCVIAAGLLRRAGK